jgi:hypothetical protein
LREDDTKTYSIPSGLLKWHSSYFAAALDPVNRATFQENAMSQLELHESIAVFDAFHCWLYTGRLKDVTLRDDDTPSDDLYLDTYTLFRTWAFADMRGIPDLGNAVVDMLHESSVAEWTALGQKKIQWVFENTMPGSELRQYVVDLTAKTGNYETFQARIDAEVTPLKFLILAMPQLVRNGVQHKGIGRPAWTKMNRCQWHDHSGPGGKLPLESRKLPKGSADKDDAREAR